MQPKPYTAATNPDVNHPQFFVAQFAVTESGLAACLLMLC